MRVLRSKVMGLGLGERELLLLNNISTVVLLIFGKKLDELMNLIGKLGGFVRWDGREREKGWIRADLEEVFMPTICARHLASLLS